MAMTVRRDGNWGCAAWAVLWEVGPGGRHNVFGGTTCRHRMR
ncbi:hypothetical protein ABH925_004822 [Streptacidiphilus sp. EB129]